MVLQTVASAHTRTGRGTNRDESMVIQTLPNEDKRGRLRQESVNLNDQKILILIPDSFLHGA